MKYAIIEGNVITNIVVADPEFAKSQEWIEITGNQSIGWMYVDGQFIEPSPIDNSEEIKDQNKAQASILLQATDWVELGDVANPANPPYLTNKAEFTTYRAALRMIAVNPPVELVVFPTKPEEIWSEM